MKYTIFFSLLVTATLQAFGQTDYTVAYYPFIHQAEAQLIQNNYAAALPFYQQAFEQTKGGFSEDFANAAVCAAKAIEDEVAYRWIDSLMTKGIEYRFITEFQGLEPLRSKQRWITFISGMEYRRAVLDRPLNNELKARLGKMHDDDQEFRVKEGSYKVYGDTIKAIDARNIAELRNIIATYGFPDEDLLGVTWPAEAMPANIVLHHHCQSMSLADEGKYDFTPDFVLAVQQGRMEPHYMAYLLSMQGSKAMQLGGWGLTAFTSNEKDRALYVEKFSDAKRLEIDQLRLSHGLEALDVYARKALFKQKNLAAKDFVLSKWGRLNIFEIENPEELKDWLLSFDRVD